ncbi:hypothetical protein ASPZODRAFT_18140 [Penicilliopsis zonata CBS 506.65]|uniref:Secreted protein n=1 Tax=Penicilliopsis zonata CBS 506.65 TaxID=1073090 RepID=A0A1L9SBP7_9EURO|nr:hypothetical protein ASPZODRAFT_18140 [Penicilliopsis zonata CBS 506.65]OJJ44564.1 hypothetical protein ASPZODRAFT_18140 [Penicilliopsis zonata CBS 506.65]
MNPEHTFIAIFNSSGEIHLHHLLPLLAILFFGTMFGGGSDAPDDAEEAEEEEDEPLGIGHSDRAMNRRATHFAGVSTGSSDSRSSSRSSRSSSNSSQKGTASSGAPFDKQLLCARRGPHFAASKVSTRALDP